MRTLILDNYDSFTYNLYQYCAELGGNPVVKRNDEVTLEEIKAEGFTHIIISPGPGSPEKKKDFGVCGDVIKKFTGVLPILGVCLGHQGIIHVFGGRIKKAPVPVHGKKNLICVDNTCPLFGGLPKVIEGMRYHSLIADFKKIPDELYVIAKTKKDKLIMGVAHKKYPLYGIQFHPESIGTPFGKQILKNFLNLKQQKSLNEKEAEIILDDMVKGRMTENEMGNFLKNLAIKGETSEEICGMARGMRKYAVDISLDNMALMDTCGTGGSGLSRMNISTAVAFVLAGAGVNVAKHGNRAASGRCGSFDLLEKLGINIHLFPEAVAYAIKKIGIGFIFAPRFHPAMKLIAPVRKKLGIRTIFNLLGPLTNPANPRHHLLGTVSPEIAEKLIHAMQKLGYARAMVVTGEDGLDEVTLTGRTTVFELKNGVIRKYDFSPKDIGIKQEKNFKAISGGTAKKNAGTFELLLKGKASKSLQNLLEINAAFGFVTSGTAKNQKEGLRLARKIIKSGLAYKKFTEYKTYSNSFLAAIKGKKQLSVIAELKRRSPSYGQFQKYNIADLARIYEEGGASAISVVTEPLKFGGSIKLLRKMRLHTRLPIIRKDFMNSKKQIKESARAGANAVLLIARMLDKKTLKELVFEAKKYNLDPVVEIHDKTDISKIRGLPEVIIGINNRDLSTFKTNVRHAFNLIPKLPKNATVIIESGFSKTVELKQYRGKADAALIGTALLTAKNPGQTLKSFTLNKS